MNQFRRPAVEPTLDGLVVGYATPSDSAWPGALAALLRALPEEPGQEGAPLGG